VNLETITYLMPAPITSVEKPSPYTEPVISQSITIRPILIQIYHNQSPLDTTLNLLSYHNESPSDLHWTRYITITIRPYTEPVITMNHH